MNKKNVISELTWIILIMATITGVYFSGIFFGRDCTRQKTITETKNRAIMSLAGKKTSSRIIKPATAKTIQIIEYLSNLWKGLIGEAVSEGYNGMLNVACCYRNRLKASMPLGCVALKRKDLDAFVARQGKKYEIMAKEIIRKVFKENALDIVNGAVYYENIEAFGVPYWAKGMTIAARQGRHTFYKK